MKQNLGKVSTNFSRGLNSKVTASLIDANEVQVSENMLYDEGTPYVRKGTKLYNDGANLSAPVVMIQKFYNRNLSSYFCAVAGGKFWTANLSGSFSVLSSEALSGAISKTAYTDRLWLASQSGNVLGFDGSTIRRMGVSSPRHTKVIADFETDEVWSTGIADTTYLRVTQGDQAWKVQASGSDFVAGTSGKVRADLSTSVNLAFYSTDLSSIDKDLIKIFMFPEVRANISTIDLIFDCNDGTFDDTVTWGYSTQCYWARLTDLSTYQSIGTDGVGADFALNKSQFSSPASTVYSWSSVTAVRIEIAQATSSAVATFDNLRMEKTPPTATIISSNYTTDYVTEFYGSTLVKKRQLVRPQYSEEAFGTEVYRTITTIEPAGERQIATASTSGITSGLTYLYEVTYVKRGHNDTELESLASFQSSGITPTGNASTHHAIQLNDIPISDDADVVARKLYRRATVDNQYSHLYTILDNTTESFSDDIPRGFLGHTLEQDHDPPPQAQYILKTNNQRIYLYNITENGVRYPSRVRYSRAYEPEYYPLTNGVDVSPEDGGTGTGIFEHLNLIYLHKENSTWLLDENNALRNVHPKIGNVAPESLAQSERETFWLSNDAVIEFRMNFKRISDGEPSNNSIRDIIERLPKDYRKNAKGTYFDGFYLLAVTDEGSTVNNLVLCWDTKTRTWTTFPNLQVTSWTVTEGGIDPYELFYGNYSGQVFQLFTGNCDYSSVIASKIRSKEFGIASPETSFRFVYLQTESLDGEQRTLKVDPYVDFVNVGSPVSVQATSTWSVTKHTLEQPVYGNFLSLEISSSGRYRVAHVDVYGKEEELR